ncbi:MAG TPA: lamin tail domain-containing protein [Patescibacteria group bacterium]|nr:lamin tail domain-containing protein [Patescibacteria group bacterium]
MKRFIKLLIFFLIFNIGNIGLTNSYFSDKATLAGNTVSTGCWVAPSVPQLVYPANGYHAIPGSGWLANPYMDWEDSTSTCPLATITYQYRSYRDAGLTQLAYQSIWLSNSQIAAPGTPDGTYYWHVRAKDQFGNTSDFSEPWLLTVDRSVPPPEPTPVVNGVVLNEILPNPEGDDSQHELAGEWVELYNNGDTAVDVSGWYIRDAASHTKTVSTLTTLGGQVILGAKGSGTEWLVLFMNDDILNNTETETVTLYTNTGVEVDSYTFSAQSNDDDSDSANTPGGPNSIGVGEEGKSFARVPDGTGPWYDPVATPGGPNKLEEGPTVDLRLRSDKHAVSFQVNNIKKFKTLSYEITYDAKPVEKQIAGAISLTNEDSFARNDLILGTCSSFGKVCVYDWGITKITLKVVLTLPNSQTTEIIKEIAY